jgi:hypothetical protein
MATKTAKKKTKPRMGRPPLFSSPEDLQKKIDQYFEKPEDFVRKYNKDGDCIEEKPIWTITGLVLFCGFCDRSSFYALEHKPDFMHTIKKARTRIENKYEQRLFEDKCTGAIFALKNFKWVDTHKVEHEVNINLVERMEKAHQRTYNRIAEVSKN